MQVVQKVKGVSLKVAICCLYLLCSKAGYGQEAYRQFSKNFSKVLVYPRTLIDSCTPAYTNVIIDIDKNGYISDILISDSAPAALKEKFNVVKGKLKKELFQDYVGEQHFKNCGLLIPVFYVFATDTSFCGNPYSEDLIRQQYFQFNLNKYQKLVLPLTPIVNKIYKPVK